MGSRIKSYTSFIQETDVVGHDEPQATKPTALSESWCNKIQECMQEGLADAKKWHDDEHKEHTAENWMAECSGYVKECMEGLMNACSEMMITQDTYNRADGGMRQDTVQDVPVMGGAMR
jgi:hypothetical protein